MKIDLISIENVIPYSQNSRKHSDEQINRIALSIAEFGFNQPIVVDEKNIILVGHGRLEAAKKLLHKEVPVLKLTNLSDAQKRAYRILDNRIAEESEWDYEALAAEVELLTIDEFDIKKWELDWWDSHQDEDSNEQKVENTTEKLIIITCLNEQQQQELFQEFEERQLSCKLIG